MADQPTPNVDAVPGRSAWRGVVAEFRDQLRLPADAPAITLLEGDTPLIPAPRLADRLGLGELWLKFEGMNPTGSFKDRGMCVAVSGAVAEGASAIVCASTGNTSAAAAAYAARAGLRCGVVLPAGNIALGKLAQALIHGADVIPVDGNFDDALRIVRELADTGKVTLVNSVNPLRIEGQKTVAFEIIRALGRVPDIHTLPVGNAGNISAAWLGYTEARDHFGTGSRPKMWGAQAAGAAPFVRGGPVAKPQTIATAIRIGNPASWDTAVAARDDSGGLIEAVTDAEILAAYRLLADTEGVFCEPASAAGVALLLQKASRGEVPAGAVAVATLTGHGLKDPDRVVNEIELPPTVPAELGIVAERLGL